MFAVIIVVVFLTGLAGLLALMSSLEPTTARVVTPAVTTPADRADDAAARPRAA